MLATVALTSTMVAISRLAMAMADVIRTIVAMSMLAMSMAAVGMTNTHTHTNYHSCASIVVWPYHSHVAIATRAITTIARATIDIAIIVMATETIVHI